MTVNSKMLESKENIENIDDDVVLRLDDLSISFGGLKAVDSLTFDIKEKEIFGLIGPNGAGKTTAFNCITQFYKPDRGSVYFRTNKGEVENLVGKKPHEIIKKGLVRTFQNVELIKELTVLQNVLVGSHIEFKASLLSQILRLPKARKEEIRLRKKAEEVLEYMGLHTIKDQLVAGQPYGVLKKIELARTLMCNPRLIILDEPAAGLNDSETFALIRIVRGIRDRYNCSILLVEHDMRFVTDLCDRICAISFGKLIFVGTPQEIQANEQVQVAYLGKGDE
ncbi:MAG: putative branched-chain amino acid transporter, ATP-binding component [Clostridiales bacterium]|nr:putative branched-chain amino acid transporter, ATP-binding component [Clostridiales bacterium]